jgi:hypothetical protein
MGNLINAMIFLLLVFILAFTFAGCYFPYILLKPYLKSKEGRTLVLRGFVILALLSGAAYFTSRYFMSEPVYFEQGIEQLHNNKNIQSRINGFSSYSFYEDSLKKSPNNPAAFQVELIGDSIKLYLTCTMLRVHDKWKLIKIHQDSIGKAK